VTVTVLHANNYEDWTRGNRTLRDAVADAGPAEVAKALAEGLYLAVATLPGDDLALAVRATQNEGMSRSWSREAPSGIVPLGAGTIPCDGKALGYRETRGGDVLLLDGTVHVVRDGRIESTDIAAPSHEDIPVIGGGRLGSAPPSP
jgi:hypothetical protein